MFSPFGYLLLAGGVLALLLVKLSHSAGYTQGHSKGWKAGYHRGQQMQSQAWDSGWQDGFEHGKAAALPHRDKRGRFA